VLDVAVDDPEIIDSHGFVDCSVSLSLLVIPSRVTVSVSSIPL
jgi:hypothetical protein